MKSIIQIKQAKLVSYVLLIVASAVLSGCASAPIYSTYAGDDGSIVEVSAGGTGGWMANTLGGFWCKVSDIDGVYHRLQEKIRVSPGIHRIDITWSKITSPVGAPIKSIGGKKILFLEVAPSSEYEIVCNIRRTISGYVANFGLKGYRNHNAKWCESDDSLCLAEGLSQKDQSFQN